uniref:G-protein coupled receptors family 1 profile domain-containing protein n=1 Tax=Biomphalaria glabrata TaxID=6526 RepID=A0A2C9K6Q2_BIOGL
TLGEENIKTNMAARDDENLTTTTVRALSPHTSPNTTEELIAILERLSPQRVLENVPAMIFVSFLMRRFRKTPSNYFILTMAIFDLIACVIGMPTEIYDLNNPYTFYSMVGCKILRWCETFTVYGSLIVLLEIGFDRYFKICRPLMMVISLYMRIWMEIRCRRRMVIGDQIAKDESNDSRKRLRIKYVPSVSEDEALNNSVHQSNSVSMTELQMNSSGKTTLTQTSVVRRTKMQSIAMYASRLKVTRTTLVLFAVTVAFVLSYLPALAVMVVRSIVKDFDRNQTGVSRAILKICANCIFINNAINPIIYSFLNIHFRRQVKKTIQRVFCCFHRRRPPPTHTEDGL